MPGTKGHGLGHTNYTYNSLILWGFDTELNPCPANFNPIEPTYKMTRFLFVLCFISCCLASQAQMIHGFELGANMMNGDLSVENENINTSTAWGPRVGYRGEYSIGKHLHAGIGGLYMQKGFRFAEETWAVNSFDVPLSLGYDVDLSGERLKLFFDGGLSFEYNFRAITRIDDNPVELTIGNEEGDIKRFTSGFSIGTGIRLNQLIKFRINYYQGISNLINTEGPDSWKNQFLGFSLAFFFKNAQS